MYEKATKALIRHGDFQKKPLVNRYIELCNPFSRIAIRSLELDNPFSRIAIRSLGLQCVIRGNDLQLERTDCPIRRNELQSDRTDCPIRGNECQSERTSCPIRGNNLLIRENGLHNSLSRFTYVFFLKIPMSLQGFRTCTLAHHFLHTYRLKL